MAGAGEGEVAASFAVDGAVLGEATETVTLVVGLVTVALVALVTGAMVVMAVTAVTAVMVPSAVLGEATALTVTPPLSTVTYGFKPTGVATGVPGRTMMFSTAVVLAVLPLLDSVAVARKVRRRVPMKLTGICMLSWAVDQALKSTGLAALPALAVKRRVPSLRMLPAGRPSNSSLSCSEPSRSFKLALALGNATGLPAKA